MHQIHLQNIKLKQYIPCKCFVKHLVGAELQWAAERCSSEEWCARGAGQGEEVEDAAAARGDRRGKRRRVAGANGKGAGGGTSASAGAILFQSLSGDPRRGFICKC